MSKYFVAKGCPAEGGHFNERRISQLAKEMRKVGFGSFLTPAYGGMKAGSKYGWSSVYYWKVLVAESILALLWVRVRPKGKFFGFWVPHVLAGFKVS